MSDTYIVALDGLSAARDLDSLPQGIRTAAVRAVNKTADRATASSRRRVREQVNFAARYLSGEDSSGRPRLGISKKATGDDMEAVITGRFRPTSLARFVTSGRPGKAGVRVQVAPGFARMMRRAFLIHLRAGSQPIETKSNLGLAIRLREGETIHNKKKLVQLKGNLYLLYGPSVDQIFNTVREDVAPEASDFLGAEFARLLEVDLK